MAREEELRGLIPLLKETLLLLGECEQEENNHFFSIRGLKSITGLCGAWSFMNHQGMISNDERSMLKEWIKPMCDPMTDYLKGYRSGNLEDRRNFLVNIINNN